MSTSSLLLAAETRPAGGAAIGEVLLATALGLGLTAVLLALVFLHRTRRSTVLTRAGTTLGRATGVPPWVALPTVLTTISLLTALLGMLWDIALHIGVGRDEGPLANPAHFLILFGLFGVFAGGVLACSMPLDEKPGPASVRFIKGWHVPIGGILLASTGLYALLGFPLDDVWHRLFGQDVTLWGPTHLMLIGGAGLSLVGLLVLEQEGHGTLSSDDGDLKAGGGAARFIRQASAMGGLLLGLSVFQGEYDFDVPQFRLVLEPLMIAGAAGVALVAARLYIGRGGALAAAGFFLAVRGVIAVVVGPVFGEIPPTFPLYLVSALIVELLALALPLARKPLVFGAVAGALIGTLGHASEVAWTQATATLAWGSDIAVEGTLMAIVGGVSGGLLGALLALPALPWVMGITGPVQHVYTASVPADNRGTYLVTGQGVMQLFAWQVEMPAYPDDAPTLPAGSIEEVAVVAREFDEPAAYRLVAVDTGRPVPWAGSRRVDGQLRLVPPPLPGGRYEIVVPRDSSFGGVTTHYFRLG